MTEETKTIIERIQKLMQLEQGAKEIGSLEEAANAQEKAQKLLLKYNLEMSDISRHNPEKKQSIGRSRLTEVMAKKNEGRWIYQLYASLAHHNFCQVITTTFWMDNGKKNAYVNLVGTKDNVTVVKFLAEQLEARIRTLETKAWNSEGKYGMEKRNAFRRGYFMGAVMGVDRQLMDAQAKAMQNNVQVNALVVQTGKELQEAVQSLFANLTKAKGTRDLSADRAGQLGYRDGKSMNINKGVDGRSSNPALN